jgi:hypothetical protein
MYQMSLFKEVEMRGKVGQKVKPEIPEFNDGNGGSYRETSNEEK